MKTPLIALFISSVIALTARAQTGEVDAVFTSTTGMPTHIHLTRPPAAGDDKFTYWFTHPATGRRFLQTMPPRGFADKKDFQEAFLSVFLLTDDIDLYTWSYHEDNNQLILQDGLRLQIVPPKYDYREPKNNQPLHLHVESYSPTEIVLRLSGVAGVNSLAGNGSYLGTGIISGTVHLYRRNTPLPRTDVTPGCSCDPTIYNYIFDPEGESRNASACEVAFQRRMFLAMQQALRPVYTLDYGGKGKGKPGDLTVNPCTNCINTNRAVAYPDDCSGVDTVFSLATVGMEKRVYEDAGNYGLRVISVPGDDIPGQATQKATGDQIRDLMKAYQAKQITMEELQRRTKELNDAPALKQSQADFHRAEIDNDLQIAIRVNPEGSSANARVNKREAATITHHIPQAIAEVYSPLSQDADGHWNPDCLTVYLGGFTPPAIGVNATGRPGANTRLLVPAGANKLTCYGIAVEFRGDKRLIDKAIASLDWNALKQFIHP